MPQPPENLKSLCAPLSAPPSPFADPERLAWEVGVVTAYADCATKHRLTVEAWTKAAAIQ